MHDLDAAKTRHQEAVTAEHANLLAMLIDLHAEVDELHAQAEGLQAAVSALARER